MENAVNDQWPSWLIRWYMYLYKYMLYDNNYSQGLIFRRAKQKEAARICSGTSKHASNQGSILVQGTSTVLVQKGRRWWPITVRSRNRSVHIIQALDLKSWWTLLPGQAERWFLQKFAIKSQKLIYKWILYTGGKRRHESWDIMTLIAHIEHFYYCTCLCMKLLTSDVSGCSCKIQDIL